MGVTWLGRPIMVFTIFTELFMFRFALGYPGFLFTVLRLVTVFFRVLS